MEMELANKHAFPVSYNQYRKPFFSHERFDFEGIEESKHMSLKYMNMTFKGNQ